MVRNILIFGATGKQGSAAVRYLLATTSPPDFHVWALTRNASSPAAAKLVSDIDKAGSADRLTVIEGNLENAESIRTSFDTVAEAESGLWGVLLILAFPGLGIKDNRERDHGIMVADFALQYRAEVFVYSSAMQPNPDPERTVEYSRVMKKHIEDHCRDLGAQGLNWIILQPGFFLENFEGLIGAITVTFFREGLHEDTTLAVITADDIGRVAAGVFANHERYTHRVLGLVSEFVTTRQIMDAYQRGSGKPMPTIPGVVAWVLMRLNTKSQQILDDVEMFHESRKRAMFETLGEEIELGRSVCQLQTVEEWARGQQQTEAAGPRNDAGWNKVSVWKLLTGRL